MPSNDDVDVARADLEQAAEMVLSPDAVGVLALVQAVAALALLRGAPPRHHRLAVMAWADANRDRLAAEWNRLNPDLSL